MADKDRSKEELLAELQALRSRVTELENQMSLEAADRELLQLYQLLIEMSPDAMIILQDERHAYVNPAFTKIFGYTQDEMKDESNFLKLVPDQEKAAIRRLYEDRLSGKTVPRTYRSDLIAKDGSLVPCETSAERIEYHGRPAGLVILRDISERTKAKKELQNAYNAKMEIEKKVEQRTAQWQATHDKLQESDIHYRTLVETMNEGLMAENAQGEISYCNDRICEMLGCRRSQLIGRPTLDFISPTDKSFYQQQTAIRSKTTSAQYKLHLLAPDRRRIPVSVSVKPLFNERGAYEGNFAVITDITKIKQAEAASQLSEQKYRTLFEQAADSIVLFDVEQGEIVEFNDKACTTLGYTREEFAALGISEIEVNESAEEIHRHIAKIYAQGSDLFETRHRTKTGEILSIQVKTKATILQGKPYIQSIWRDITKQKQVEDQMRRLLSAIEQSTEGIAISDLEGNLQFINRSFAHMHGYDPQELLGANLSNFHTPEQMPTFNAANEQTKRTGSYNGEIWHVRRDGCVFPGLMHKSLLRDAPGKAVGMIGILTDISELKKITRELSQLREQIYLVERISQVSMLGAALAHELNQPLSVIRLLMQENRDMLNEMSYPAAVRDNCNEVLSAVSRTVDIIHRYRHYASLPRKKRTKNINLVQLAQRMRQMLWENARMAKVDIYLDLPEDMLLLEGDISEIEQIFFILMQNAIQAADGRQEHNLRIQGEIRAEKIILQFADDCGGIPPENRDKIFEPFFTTKPSGKGTGLGLSILERILRDNNGGVELENQPDQGSVFIVTLPVTMPE